LMKRGYERVKEEIPKVVPPDRQSDVIARLMCIMFNLCGAASDQGAQFAWSR